MSDIVVKAEGLGKSYVIGHNGPKEKYKTLRDVLLQHTKSAAKKTSDLFKGNPIIAGDVMEEFWALKDVNFEINRGDAVGIIGRNGAGKSTLLKVLSRITEPSEGRCTIKGRIASLLEVGTGFHPELSGRDNIFLNGAILGMSRSEIRSKFEEIVDFAGVEKFLDTPVKKYSSGMYVRLAFAVSAYLESEILIVDEVLAVGDAEFQKKCLGKMGDVSKKDGRTVLFVSHNISAIRKLCNKGVFLENGIMKLQGPVEGVLDVYENKVSDVGEFTPFNIKEIKARVLKIAINQNQGYKIIPTQPFTVDIEILAEEAVKNIGLELLITNTDTNGILFATNTKTRKNIDVTLKEGLNKFTCHIDELNLSSGKYWLGFGIDMPMVQFYFYEKELIRFEIDEVIIKPNLLPTLPAYGHFYMNHNWIFNN